MHTATTRLLDALRAAHGNCTDYRAGKLLGVSTSTVSKWRVGKGHMSTANVRRACELAGEDAWEWNLRVAAERERGPDGDIYRDAVRDLEAFRATGEAAPDGLFALLTRGTRAAAILACAGLLALFANPGKSSAASVSADQPSTPVLYIMVTTITGSSRRFGRCQPNGI